MEDEELRKYGLNSYHATQIATSSAPDNAKKVYRNLMEDKELREYGLNSSQAVRIAVSSAPDKAKKVYRNLMKDEELREYGLNSSQAIQITIFSAPDKAEKVYRNLMKDEELRGYGLNSYQAVRIAISSEVTRLFYLLIAEKALLPGLNELLTDEIRRYIAFRRLLRSLDLNRQSLRRIAETLLPKKDSNEFDRAIDYSCDQDSLLLKKVRSGYENRAIIELRDRDREAYEKLMLDISILLYSLDENIRYEASFLLQKWFFPVVEKRHYKDEEEQGIATDILIETSRRSNLYHHYLRGDIKIPDYYAYLLTSLKYIHKLLGSKKIPKEIRSCYFASVRFKTTHRQANMRESSIYEVEEHLSGKGFDPEIVRDTLTFGFPIFLEEEDLARMAYKGDTKTEGSPAKFLETLRDNPALLRKVRSDEGFTVKEVIPLRKREEGAGVVEDDKTHYSPSTVYKEAEVLEALGIIEKVDGYNKRANPNYRFSDPFIGPNQAYTLSLIDAVNRIEDEIGKRNMPLHRYDIPEDKYPNERAFVRELVNSDVDIESAAYLVSNALPRAPSKPDTRHYVARYNKSKLDEYRARNGIRDEKFSPEALLKKYVEILRRKGIDIELKASRSKRQGLISVECYTSKSDTKPIGKGHVDIKGDLYCQPLRIIGMFNMALAASNIRKNTPYDKMNSYERRFISFIKHQCKAITGIDISEDEILEFIKELPPASAIPVDKIEEYYRLTIEQLRQAA